ncbi:unnamed protein product [Didymodactylos carnosus]|uniref:Uncharacterized protein n=1 Tax=Didymodactylos carnosus TaxID=1234261 RepID=A0A814YL28_9BILA|nr:unnamed protein product [Didymodactylos carnosus]CAF1230324.1 unnamed protein product [Didymodactylos carnosus]CAF3689263.1 unnamed protein product [Didymodactylos carnosus]CAF3993013.1 unnamed protein product [Didymodactylos carnosus]
MDPSYLLHGTSSRKHESYVGGNDDPYYGFAHSSTWSNNSTSHGDRSLRFIVIRHGERVDVMYGAGWTQRAFAYGQYNPFDANMPPSLPYRANWMDYEVDTPLTSRGLLQSWNVGNVLNRFNLPITACYSSPAFRSIETADKILEGMGRKMVVPIRLELGLFECTSWYAQAPITFMSEQELLHGGFNIDQTYRSQISDLKLFENEYQYYDRSRDAMKKIIKLHKKTGGTILLVAHAPSLEVLTRNLMNGQPRPERLADLAAKVDFCSMTIVERESSSKPWQFRYNLDDQLSQEQQYLESSPYAAYTSNQFPSLNHTALQIDNYSPYYVLQ